MDKIFGRALVFIWNTALREISLFQQFIASIDQAFILWERLGTTVGYKSMKFWDLTDLSWLPKILSFKFFGKWWGSSCIPCLLLITMLRFTCGEKKFRKVSKIFKTLLYPWLYTNSSFAFCVFINSSNFYNSLILAWAYFNLQKSSYSKPESLSLTNLNLSEKTIERVN